MNHIDQACSRSVFQQTEARVDAALNLMLGVQILTMFVVIPVGWQLGAGRTLLNVCHLTFAAICICVFTQCRMVQCMLITALIALSFGQRLTSTSNMQTGAVFMSVSFVAFLFNAIITVLVAQHVFDGSKVTSHRLRGAVLVYLNVAALFSISYNALDMLSPGAIAPAGGGVLSREIPAHTAALTYFSLTTITTAGFGDLVPVSPIARSLANLEAVFGHLFPATLLARLVALHVARGSLERPSR